MILVSLLFIIFHALYLMSILVWHFLYCTWFKCIRSYLEDLNHGFLANRFFVYSWFMDLDNPFKVLVNYFIIGEMTDLGHQDGVPIMSALVYMATCTLDNTYSWSWHNIIESSWLHQVAILYCVLTLKECWVCAKVCNDFDL